MTDTQVATSIVLYTHASFYLEAKVSGAGIHGYTFIEELPKKGSGNPKAVPTAKGYLHPSFTAEKVSIVEYVDLIHPSDCKLSNNEAELDAFNKALEWLIETPQYTTVLLVTASRFVGVGIEKMLAKWEQAKWVTGNGQPVKYRPLWESVRDNLAKLRTDRTVVIETIKEGEGYLGHDVATKHSEKGAALTRNKDKVPVIELTPSQGYWGVKNNAPRLLQYPRWYFSTVEEDYLLEDGSAVYYVGCHGGKDKEDELNGKPYADNFFGVVICKTPDPVMEMIRKLAIDNDKHRRGAVCIGRLDSIFSAKGYKTSQTYGTRFMTIHRRKMDINDADGSPIVVEQTPIGLGLRMIDSVNTLRRALQNVLAGDPYYRSTDITNILYEGDGSKESPVKLASKITQVTKFIDLNVEFNLTKAKETPDPFTGTIRLILGHDVLSRNQMAALTSEVESIKVITWRESDVAGRYAVLVTMKNGDVGLWARSKANLFLKREK